MKGFFACGKNLKTEKHLTSNFQWYFTMKKEERVKRYGKAAYEKVLQQGREYKAAHPEEAKAQSKAWRGAHPEEAKATNNEVHRKGGKYYEQKRAYEMEGIQHEKGLVRVKHRDKWRPYKKVIAPDSVLHHEWIPGTSDYRGVALVEKDQHQYGYVDVIKILEGEITLLTEEEIRRK